MLDPASSARERVRDTPTSAARTALDAAFAELDLTNLGWARAARHAPAELLASHPNCVPARVARVDRGRRLLVACGGEPPRHVHDRTGADDPGVVGDWVLVEGDVAVARLPRRGVLARRNDTDSTAPHVISANVDVVLVAEALAEDRSVNAGRVARFAAIARAAEIDVHVVLTHADRAPAWPLEVSGVPALATSIVDGRGIEQLRGMLGTGETATIVGASGAGKSSLVNALCGDELQATSSQRASGTGRHTTSTSPLVPIPGGGLLANTPGIRLVGMHADVDIDAVIPTAVTALAASCRFQDCLHVGGPGCAVLEAVAAGTLDAHELDSWRRLGREAMRERARSDAKVRAQLRASDRALGRSVERARRRGDIIERRGD
jgi:ribosome biogenesis GTPase